VEWYKFNPNLFEFDASAMTWKHIGEFSLLARAGAAAATNGNGAAWCIGGETKPGIRAPEISKIVLTK
jgi:N-acetylneuraminic acid mutarotase